MPRGTAASGGRGPAPTTGYYMVAMMRQIMESVRDQPYEESDSDDDTWEGAVPPARRRRLNTHYDEDEEESEEEESEGYSDEDDDDEEEEEEGVSPPLGSPLSLEEFSVASKLTTVANPNQKTCLVCQDDMRKGQLGRRLYCCHLFHAKCIERWLDQNPSCPVCKQVFTVESMALHMESIKDPGAKQPSTVPSSAASSSSAASAVRRGSASSSAAARQPAGRGRPARRAR
eukprot:NODE_739_length_1201_cov_544.653646_g479_i1.p1 GENE.NODE_739_length_1201_cov_544.653646_g479_i1~~NODE_739_length_1201_cov_544.653646_g479_i1.p1  ORF type:complete len:250 (-),score=81.45 NODE_739_length_1201_cov_544.653646_g479_i1:452-1141(-)